MLMSILEVVQTKPSCGTSDIQCKVDSWFNDPTLKIESNWKQEDITSHELCYHVFLYMPYIVTKLRNDNEQKAVKL